MLLFTGASPAQLLVLLFTTVLPIAVVIYVIILLTRFVRAVEKIARSLEKATPAEQDNK